MTLRKHSYNNVPSLTAPVALDEMPKRTSSKRRLTNALALTATTLFASGAAQANYTCPYQGSGISYPYSGLFADNIWAKNPCSIGKGWTLIIQNPHNFNIQPNYAATIFGDGTQGGGLQTAGGTVLNDGTLTVQSGANLSVKSNPVYGGGPTGDGLIRNSGTLTNYGQVYTMMNRNALLNYGLIQNQANATLNNAGYLENVPGGSLTNSGTINNSGTMLQYYGSLANNGTINSTGTLLISQESGSLTNNGTIYNSGTLLQYNGSLANNGTITTTGTFNVYAGSTVNGTGTFTQSAGTTTVNGMLTQTTINLDGGTLNGSGTITGTINQNGGTFSPGNSPGTITINGDYYVNGTVAIQLYDQKPGFYDIVDVNGVVTFGSNALIDIDLTQNATQAGGQFWDFIWSDTTFFNSQNVHYEVTGLAAGLGYSIHEVSVGNRNVLEFSLVPEPGSLSLFAIGLAGLGFARTRARPT